MRGAAMATALAAVFLGGLGNKLLAVAVIVVSC